MRVPQVAPLDHTHVPGAPCEDACEALMVLPDLLPHRSRQLPILDTVEAHTVIAAHDPHFGEFVRVWNWQAAQPNGVEQLN
ncbi:MAG: hypothetical protein DMG26_02655 [Acidobacteria bacterium]|nr:MAG: hypothetical protein DMG26_02655 [Acidobacteriota bacterium]